ncbi:MAG: GDP-mannose 4,6-dehydratase [Chloroflexi bacterium]|nr:GDP-mannose 4,6-dehydratase [Chloroflexota bacterium]
MCETNGWKNKNLLITGGAGFIGSHLVEKFVEAGADVTVIDNFVTGCLENLSRVTERLDLRSADILSIDWEDVLAERSYDAIVHLAANAYVPPSVERPALDYQINLEGTFRLLEALRRHRWPGTLVYASSAAVYGQGVRMPIQEGDPTVPISPYGVSKLAAERYVAVYSQLYGLRAASARLFSVYGPRQRKQVLYDLMTKLLHDPRELHMHGDGKQTRDFSYVGDAASAVMRVAGFGRLHGEVYNVASGRECSIYELAETLCRVLRVRPIFVFSGSVRPGDPERWLANVEQLGRLGYLPQTTLEEGIRKTVEWFVAQTAELSVLQAAK